MNWLQAFHRHKNATTTKKYLKSPGLKPPRQGLGEGFKRPGEEAIYFLCTSINLTESNMKLLFEKL